MIGAMAVLQSAELAKSCAPDLVRESGDKKLLQLLEPKAGGV